MDYGLKEKKVKLELCVDEDGWRRRSKHGGGDEFYRMK